MKLSGHNPILINFALIYEPYKITIQAQLMKQTLYIFSILLLLTSCIYKNPTIDGFNKETWEADEFGCNNQRIKYLQLLKDNKATILSLKQNEVKELLGNPDEHELYERTRKFFYYYLEPSIKCDSTLTETPRILQLRFNALDLCNEVFVKNEY